MKPILEIQNISKTFRIHSEKQAYLSLRDSLSSILKSRNNSSEIFYALQNVSFDVNIGDTVGIIGKNGAGKSTLLKILSKITPPTSGKIISRGRIASLLEVGTGFHPELSGRENIFLNGSILGMKRAEIRKKFDAIVDFAGVQKFIDTPLKHYSSGMQLRLAFAVAAFLENEILIIDEVLAVGDAEFQEKCLGKMENISKSGRTILFVSHNMGALQSLCSTAFYLEQGKVVMSGKSSEVIKKYLQRNLSQTRFKKESSTSKDIFIKQVLLLNENKINRNLSLAIAINSNKPIAIAVDFRIYTVNGIPVCFGSLGTFNKAQLQHLIAGLNDIKIDINTGSLANGLYYISIDLTEPDKEYYERAEQVLFFEILNATNNPSDRVLLQDWGYGNFTIPVAIIK